MVALKKRLSDLGYFYTRYNNTEDLKYQFLQQPEMLKEKGYINLKEEVKQSSEAAVEKYLQTVNTVNKTVDNNFNIASRQGDIKNIGNIENATFNAEVGKRAFNMFLYRRLTEAIPRPVSDLLCRGRLFLQIQK